MSSVHPSTGSGSGSEAAAQSEATPFKLKASNSMSPLENWNLTALSKSTAATVIVFSPSATAVRFPK